MSTSAKIILALAWAGATLGPVWAGGPVIMPPEPAARVAPAPALDWAGPYLALDVGLTGGTATDAVNEYPIDRGTATGVALGYNFQRNSWVYGVELSIDKPNGVAVDDASVPGIGPIYDLSGRAGFALGKALVYGKLGYARTTYDNSVEAINFTGASFGGGVDYRLTRHLTLGATVTAYGVTNDPQALKMMPLVAGVRVGFQF